MQSIRMSWLQCVAKMNFEVKYYFQIYPKDKRILDQTIESGFKSVGIPEYKLSFYSSDTAFSLSKGFIE